MDIETAKKVIETLEAANRSIFGLLPFLEARCPKQEYEKLKREIARVANGMASNFAFQADTGKLRAGKR